MKRMYLLPECNKTRYTNAKRIREKSIFSVALLRFVNFHSFFTSKRPVGSIFQWNAESAKLHALCAKNMLMCQSALRAYVRTCQRALRAYVLTCQFALCSSANVPFVLTCSRANVSCVLTCSRANVLCVLACSHANVPCLLTCSCVNVPSLVTLIHI